MVACVRRNTRRYLAWAVRSAIVFAERGNQHAQLELVGGQVAQPAVDSPVADVADDGLKSNVTSLDQERTKREPNTRLGLCELPAHRKRLGVAA